MVFILCIGAICNIISPLHVHQNKPVKQAMLSLAQSGVGQRLFIDVLGVGGELWFHRQRERKDLHALTLSVHRILFV